MPNKSIIDKAGELFCFSKIEEICGDVLFLICGFDQNNLNNVRIVMTITFELSNFRSDTYRVSFLCILDTHQLGHQFKM